MSNLIFIYLIPKKKNDYEMEKKKSRILQELTRKLPEATENFNGNKHRKQRLQIYIVFSSNLFS